MDFLSETRSIPASYSRFPAFTPLPGVRLWWFPSFLTIFLVSISTGPSPLPYCPIQPVNTSNWTTPYDFLAFAVYLASYHSALGRVGYCLRSSVNK